MTLSRKNFHGSGEAAPDQGSTGLVSIVIPVFNSEKTIGSLCRDVISELGSAYALDIILVNDDSRDGSDAVCKALQEEFRTIITYLRLSRNFSEHNAVMAGLNHVRGEYVVIMDDDYQNPPGEVSKLFDEIRKGYDVVYCRYPEKRDSLFRNLGSRLNNRIARLIIHKPAGIYLSSFKAMNRFLVNEVIKYAGSEPYIDAIVLRTTANIGTVEVRHDRRKYDKSGYTFGKLFALWGNAIVSFSLLPIRIIGVIGFILTAWGLIYGGKTILNDLLPGGHDPSEYQKLTSVIAFFRGFQLLAISVVAEYVGRIYLYINRDPQYVIRELRPAAPGPRAGKDQESAP